jgi:hypothetical protein
MALYTVCATTPYRPAAPCALIEAASDDAAMREAERLREAHYLDFLPEDAHLSVRRAARREIDAFLSFMPVRPIKGPAANDGGISRRSERMRRAFYEKLWVGEFARGA